MATLGGVGMAQNMRPEGENMRFGLVTYLWASDWDLDQIVENLTQLKIQGIELRVDHAHGVSPKLSADDREYVRSKFLDAQLEIVGLGTNFCFDSPKPEVVEQNMKEAKEFVKLSHDIGGSGVKVKPDKLHVKQGVPKEQTLKQIAENLAKLGDYAMGFGQEIRLEVHGDVANLLDIREVMEMTKRDNVRVCWNSNKADIVDGHIHKSFALVKDYLGQTVHIHQQETVEYPYDDLAGNLVEADYHGWVLLEGEKKVENAYDQIAKHRGIWETRVRNARKKS